jgi:hypothetical protein
MTTKTKRQVGHRQQTFARGRLCFESQGEMINAALQVDQSTDYTTWEEPEVDALTIFNVEESDLRALAEHLNASMMVWDFGEDGWVDLD